jgi:hypothetical protein
MSNTSMTLKEVEQLHAGDEVFWNDPDDDPESNCSRIYKIQTISINGDIGS